METKSNDNPMILLELWRSFPKDSYKWLLKEFKASNYDEFIARYPPGSDGYDQVARLREFFETVGVMITHGLLDENLFFDISYHISAVWERLGPVILDWQEKINPVIEENMAWLARRYEVWQKEVWKPDMKWKLKS
ncbi:MAG TPA: hypothetical protein VGR53_08770 [Nitrososphaerales archaeon]|nr:hypothetical protein [Nitrososphaerales archaeon]